MNIKKLIDEKVTHKSFGQGVVRNAEATYLEVIFTGNGKHSKFIYPSCFYGFLTLENEEKQEALAKDLRQWRLENGVRQKEELKSQQERTTQAIKARRLAAEDKKIKAAKKSMEHRTTYNALTHS